MELFPNEDKAIDFIRNRCKSNEPQCKKYIDKLVEEHNLGNISMDKLINNIFQYSYITINFHPDRIDKKGNLVIEEMLKEGKYHSQFVTGTTSGSRTAYSGGERDLWEKELFGGFYHSSNINIYRRVKYGSLNIMNYLDGASPRFGSCYLKLNKNVADRCTFTFGDSHLKPEFLGTKDHFYSIMIAIIDKVLREKILINSSGFDLVDAITYFVDLSEKNLSAEYGALGRALDDYIEAQIHGEIKLDRDVDILAVDEAFKESDIIEYISEISRTFNIPIEWIPRRTVNASTIPDEFRGPMIKPFVKRILRDLKIESEDIDARVIGVASRYLKYNPKEWSDFGSESEVFQYLKQLWHVVVEYG